MNRSRIGALALVAVVLAGVSGSPSVFAQDDDRPVFEQVAGPYDITAILDPISAVVGRNFLYVDVDDANTGAAVSDVVVRVSMQRAAAPDAELTWSQAGRPAEKSPLAKFRATLNLDGPGPWLVGVEVSGPLGSETVHLPPVEVPPLLRSSAGVAVLAAILVIFGGGVGYLWWSARKAQRRPPPGSEVARQRTG